MATPRKQLSSYPEEYFRLMQRAIHHGRAAVPMHTRRDCERLRSILYAMRTRLLQENLIRTQLSLELIRHSQNIRFQIKEHPYIGGATLHLHFPRPLKEPHYDLRKG